MFSENQAHTVRVVKALPLRGHVEGLPLPCLQLLCELVPAEPDRPVGLDPSDDVLLAPMEAAFKARLSRRFGAVAASRPELSTVLKALEPLNTLWVRLQRTAGWPLGGGMVLQELGQRQHDQVRGVLVLLALPALVPAILLRALPWVKAQWMGSGAEAVSGGRQESLTDVLGLLEKVAPGGTNTRLLLEAACQGGVPLARLPGNLWQYGWASRSRWMDSTFTDADSVMAAKLARNKRSAHELMRRAGLPVPRQQAITTLEEACTVAREWGYPVVLKPADLDGGKGVAAGLADEVALRQAYDRSRSFSRNLVVEQHVHGRDYRLGVLNGKLAWATSREPAGVHGDGVQTLAQLLAEANKDPRRGVKRWSQMAPITIDEEAQQLLKDQAVSLDTVIDQGCFIRLRHAANVSLGGYPVDVMHQVHPDNAALAEQAARLFRLQLAGVDLLIPDVSQSWREVGGAICEINGQPQFSASRPDIPGLVIEELVKSRGRIPWVTLVTSSHSATLLKQISARLIKQNITLACVVPGGVSVEGESLTWPVRSAFDGVQAVLLDRRIDALMEVTDGLDWLKTGLPADRMALAVVEEMTDRRVARMLATACSHGVWRVPRVFSEDGAMPAGLADKLVELIIQIDAATDTQGDGISA